MGLNAELKWNECFKKVNSEKEGKELLKSQPYPVKYTGLFLLHMGNHYIFVLYNGCQHIKCDLGYKLNIQDDGDLHHKDKQIYW